MKLIIYLLLLNLFTITSFAQTYNVRIHSGGGTAFSQTTGIDSITFDVSTNFTCGDNIFWGSDAYPTVLIGNQCWFAKNLNIGTRINADQNQNNNGIIEKYCYDNVERNCVTYGGLYQWDEAMQYSTTPGAKGICPPGWHIPTFAEFQALRDAVGNDGNALKAVGQGTDPGAGTNTSGFSALLAGSRSFNGNFANFGNFAYFWSSAEITANNAFSLSLTNNGSSISLSNLNKNHGFSVRCVKD